MKIVRSPHQTLPQCLRLLAWLLPAAGEAIAPAAPATSHHTQHRPTPDSSGDGDGDADG